MSRDERNAVNRILDANANRVGEGLRTLEEAARFAIDDAAASSKLKSLRHRIGQALMRLDRGDLLRCRDTPGDVGTSHSTDSERQRVDIAAVVASAAVRVQQSMRCLEEYGKVIDVEFAADVERARYECYAVLAEVELQIRNRATTDDPVRCHDAARLQRLRRSRVYVLIDANAAGGPIADRIDRLADAGVDMVQLRDKSLPDRELLTHAIAAAAACRRRGVLFIVNDRVDVAILADADGVHIGQDELPVDEVRRLIGPTRLIGLSTHNDEQVLAAIAGGVDCIGCGPVYVGSTKSFDEYPGLAFLVRAVAILESHASDLPAFAIGGIGLSNIDPVAATGIGRIAVTAALADLNDAAATVARLTSSLESGPCVI